MTMLEPNEDEYLHFLREKERRSRRRMFEATREPGHLRAWFQEQGNPGLGDELGIVTFIECYAAEHGGNAPSLQEIANAFGTSKAAAEKQVKKLIEEGRAMRRDGKLWLTQPPLFSLLDE